MTRAEAKALVGSLVAAYPTANIEQATVELWTHQLSLLQSVEAGVQAVQEIIHSDEWFPSLARFRAVYGDKARRIAEDRKASVPALEAPREGLPDSVQEWIAAFGVAHDVSVELGPVVEGPCADCGKTDGQFRMVGERAFCDSHALSRLRVRGMVS